MQFVFIQLVIIELPLQPTLWVSPSCVQMLFLLLRDSEHVPYILQLSSKDSVVVGLGKGGSCVSQNGFINIDFYDLNEVFEKWSTK